MKVETVEVGEELADKNTELVEKVEAVKVGEELADPSNGDKLVE